MSMVLPVTRIEETQVLAAFSEGELPAGGFGHAAHVRLAWLHFKHWPFPLAAQRFDSGLRAVVERQGAADKFHATVTWAFLVLVHERWVRSGRPQEWDDFASANPDLVERGGALMREYYRQETLDSAFARQVFVLPDSPAGRGS